MATSITGMVRVNITTPSFPSWYQHIVRVWPTSRSFNSRAGNGAIQHIS
jgi:hypothetical protein